MEARAREFPFSDADFRWVQSTAKSVFGVHIVDDKRDLVYSRLAPVLRRHELSFESLRSAVKERDLEQAFIDALTTNVTSFFREPHHFELLANFARERGTAGVRLWSAGCSLGMEPYSAAMTLREVGAGPVKILGTDVDSKAVSIARSGVYELDVLSDVPVERLRRHFVRGGGANARKAKLKPETHSLVTVNQLNLMAKWPFQRSFDVVFCRNVLIYFDSKEKAELIRRFVAQLRPGGLLFLGHSESAQGVDVPLESLGRTTYRRAS
ncbi:MAG: protein-glutamate O-methyltransferase CheR [Myxococcota bacterium]